VNKNGSSKSRVVYGSHMRDSTAYSVLIGVTMRRNHGMEDSGGMDQRLYVVCGSEAKNHVSK
jgi:hypothetical protein